MRLPKTYGHVHVRLTQEFLDHVTDKKHLVQHRERWANLLPLACRYPTEVRSDPRSADRWTLIAEFSSLAAATGDPEFAVAVDLAWEDGYARLVSAFVVDSDEWRRRYASWPRVGSK